MEYTSLKFFIWNFKNYYIMRAIPLLTKQVRRGHDEKQLRDRLAPVSEFVFSQILSLKARRPHALCTTRFVLFNCTSLIFTVPQSPHVFWFNDRIQKKSQNNTKNIRQTSLKFTSLPRQKIKISCVVELFSISA